MLRMGGLLALTALLLALMLCGTAQGEETMYFDPWSYLIQEDGTVKLIQHWGSRPLEFSYPETLNGLTVTAVQLQSFDGVTTITLPDSVTTVSGSCGWSETLTAFQVSQTHPVLETVDGVLFDKTSRTLLAFPAGRPVTSYTIPEGTLAIGASAFSGCRNLTSITSPDSVTTIGVLVFQRCDRLTSISLGAGVTEIPGSAFNDCSMLQRIDVAESNPVLESRSGMLISKAERKLIRCPQRITVSDFELSVGLYGIVTIGDSAFEDCKLAAFDIPQSVTHIGASAFRSSGLSEVTIPEGVVSIGDAAFASNSKLTKVTVPSSVREIGKEAFSNNKRLDSVTLQPGLKTIGSRMFSGNDGLTEITIPASVTRIGVGAFSGCDGLTKVTLQPGLSVLGAEMFSNCTALEEVTIPASLVRIERDVFINCTALTKVTLEPGLLYTGVRMFADCPSLTSIRIPDSMLELAAGVFRGCTSLTTVELPAGLRWIAENAFAGCNAVSGLVIPAWKNDNTAYSVLVNAGTYILVADPGYAWVQCGWTNVSIAPDNKDVEIIDGALINRRDRTLITLLGPISEGCYRIPQGVERIGDYAFQDCTGLTGVIIPDSVTEIGDYAFQDCTGLTGVIIPDSVTEIGAGAFSGCTGLTSVTIPDSVTEIGAGAFSGCTGLTSVTIPDSVTEIGESAFTNCDALTSVEIPGSVKIIGLKAFMGCDSLASVVLREGVEDLGDYAFAECYKLDTLVIPDSIRSIKEHAFLSVHPRSVTVSDQTSSLVFDLLYRYCTGEGTLTITPGKAQLVMQDGCLFGMGGKRLIRYNSASTAESYTISEGVETIAAYAFYKCEHLKHVVIPEGVTTIETNAILRCNALESVTIPDSVTSIGNDALSLCHGLTEIHIGSGLTHLPYLGNTNTLAANLHIMNPEMQRNYPNPFRLFPKLTTVTVSPDNPVYGLLDGMLFNKTTGELLWCSTAREGVLVIPEEVTCIGEGALAGCTELTAIYLPDTLKPGRNGEMIPENTLPESCALIRLPSGLNFQTGSKQRDLYIFPSALTEERWLHYKLSANKTVSDAYVRIEAAEAQALYPALKPDTAVWQLKTDRAKMALRTAKRLHDSFAALGYTAEDYSLDCQLTVGWRALSMYPYEILCSPSVSVPAGVTLIIPSDNPLATEWALQMDCASVLSNGNDTALFQGYLSRQSWLISGDFVYIVSNSLATITGCVSQETVLQLPENLDGCPVVAIDANALFACPQITTVSIPTCVKLPEDNPFAVCPQLTSIQVSREHPVLATIDGVLFGKAERMLISYPAGRPENSYSIPQGIYGIGVRAFSGCTALKRITLPASIEHIAEGAFSGCEDVTFVVTANSYAHRYCTEHGLKIEFSDTPDWLFN